MFFLILNSNLSFSQIYILGNISDSTTKEAVPFELLHIRKNFKTHSITTDIDGNFKFKVRRNSKYRIKIWNKIDTIVHVEDSTVNLRFEEDWTNRFIDPLTFNWLDIYNAQVAKKDIEEGNIYLLTTEFHIRSSKRAFKRLQRITKIYGFQYICLGDIKYSGEAEAIKEYNAVVMEYLDKKNKEGWYEKMRLKIREKVK